MGALVGGEARGLAPGELSLVPEGGARGLGPGGASPGVAPRGWLRGPAFDAGLIGGSLALALALGAAAGASPAAFGWALFVDFWLLAHPHVASTFTRIAYDQKRAREHWFLLAGLPPLVLAATAGAAWAGGVVALNSAYFYWQSWHYTRQSYGIARAYQRSGGARGRVLAADVVVFAFPAWGVLRRAHQAPGEFYGMPLYCPPVPRALVLAAGALAVGALGVWAWRELRGLWRDDGPAPGHALFVLSHVAVTALSYLAVDDVTRGWLYVNVWHNAQYLLFVWAANARRFRGGEGAGGPLVARLSRPSRWPAYAALCLLASTPVYLALGASARLPPWGALPVVLVLHLTVNFHHYLVDAVIWRSPRAARGGAVARA